MRAIPDFEAKKTVGELTLPAGGYVAKIIDAVIETHNSKNEPNKTSEMLCITFDICEGEHTGFFEKLYTESDYADVKWKGVFRLFVPQEEHQYYLSQKRVFSNTIWAVEESNPGYTWDWNEMTLKGKTVGVLFRNKEWEWKGKTGMTTECAAFTDADEIRQGTYTMPKDKLLAKKETAKAPYEMLANDEDLPF